MNQSLERVLIRRCGITEAVWQEAEKLADVRGLSVCDILVQKKQISETPVSGMCRRVL